MKRYADSLDIAFYNWNFIKEDLALLGAPLDCKMKECGDKKHPDCYVISFEDKSMKPPFQLDIHVFKNPKLGYIAWHFNDEPVTHSFADLLTHVLHSRATKHIKNMSYMRACLKKQ